MVYNKIPVPASALVVGADGMIGQALAARLAAAGCSVTRTTRRRSRTNGLGLLTFDLSQPFVSVLPEVEVVFICGGLTRNADCRNNPDLADLVNHRGPIALARLYSARGSVVVYLSTSAVFDCAEPRMAADRRRAGRSVYGHTKGLGEIGILDISGRNAIVRMTKILTPDWAIAQQWRKNFLEGRVTKAFNDHRIAPIALSHALDTIQAAAFHPGIWQVSGARDLTYFEIANLLSTRAGFSNDSIVSVSAVSEGIPSCEILAFTSLDCAPIQKLINFVPPQIETLLPMIESVP